MEQGAKAMLGCVVVTGPRDAQRLTEVADALEPLARQVFRAEDTQAALACARAERPDLFLVAERGAGSAGGVEVVIGLSTCEAPVVVLAEQPSVDWAVQYVRHGAYDYVAGDLDEDMLGRLVTGIRGCGDGGDDARDHCFCDECPAGVPFVGRSEATVKVLETIRLVAESRCNPILIVGETGTGKELAARAVHAWRCGDPEQFVAVNCAALTATLLESELFGHVKGAFTGADRDKAGLFELAGRGTLFLDEISEMSPELQAKLLRVLQERSFRKVGGTRDIACEATIIASSNRDLLAASRSAKFRQDLYYRLAVFPIRLAPLRDPSRRSDISMLAEYFLRTSSLGGPEASLTPEAEGELTGHTWPGNVRELRNVLERALLLARGGQITPQELRIERVDAAPADSARASAAKKKDFSLETAEREFIIRALRETGWQRTRAAALLGITRATLHAKLKRYGIQPPDSAHCGRGQVGESSGACRRRQPQRADK